MTWHANVSMADGSTYRVTQLLGKGDSNAKLTKSDNSGRGYLTVGLSLAPAKLSGFEVCGSRSEGCTQACLFTAGQGAFSTVKIARIAKTRLFFQQRKLFLDRLEQELYSQAKRASKQRSKLAVRLNVLSDIQWEKVHPALFEMFPDVQFYDYTKHFIRMVRTRPVPSRNWPVNYHLTFSRSENNDQECRAVLQDGGNVAVVFNNKSLPANYWGYEVINGDETDLRFLDKPGTIVGLYAKGDGKKDTSGFVVPVPLGFIKG